MERFDITKKICFVEVMRAIACALITNSHLDGVYPLDISWGGCPGNCLFFMITGFLLGGDFKDVSFIGWYLKKVARLYISLILVDIIIIAVGYRTPYLGLFLFPIRQFWFIPIIVILYAIYFFTMKIDKKYRKYLLVLDLLCYFVCYFFVFDRSDFFVERHFYFLIMYGYIVMMLGTYVRERLSVYNNRTLNASILSLLLSIACIGGFLGSKLWIATNSVYALNLQFLTQFFSIGFAFLFFTSSINFEHSIRNFINNSYIGKYISWVGRSTLEVYLIQYVLIFYLKDIVFPLNLILIIVTVTIGGILLHIVSNMIFKWIFGVVNERIIKKYS